MRSAERTGAASRFLGVRLSEEEDRRLEEFRQALGVANRSEAVRALVRGAEAERPGAVDLPVTLRAELQELVELGYAHTESEAVTLAITVGLAEFARQRTERWRELRSHARDLAARRRGRARADREGRGLLGR
ncbi:MAG: ribbon-helix-helix protein, CopG family [Thermoplasmata archaeon]